MEQGNVSEGNTWSTRNSNCAGSSFCVSDYVDIFSMTQIEQDIFMDLMLPNLESLIFMLEVYKFRTRERIIEVLKDAGIEKASEYTAISRFAHSSEYVGLEKKYGVLLENGLNKQIFVYIKGFADVDVSCLELDLNLNELVIKRLTPYNFCIADDESYLPEYDVIMVFKRLLLEAIAKNATDLHFDVKHSGLEPQYTVSCRIGAELVPMDLFKLDARMNREIIGKLIENKTSTASMDLSDAGGVTASANNVFGKGSIELRICANKVKDGYHCVIRIQQEKTFSFGLYNLGFNQAVIRDLHKIVGKRSGITLITGAIRTGKNTTAFAVANEMLKLPIKMVSYESPIEVLMPITQIDYHGNETVLYNAVRLAKKQDINVAFLNEIPNKEVAFAVQDLVNSSIHVITTMHMDRLWHLPYKLREYYGAGYKDLISQINGVFNQKMFDISCPHCREQILVADLSDLVYREFLLNAGVLSVFRNHGCKKCNGTGKVQGKNQPYAEHLLFTADFKSRLLQCTEVFEMELQLYEEIHKSGQNLECYMLEGLRTGELNVSALSYVM